MSGAGELPGGRDKHTKLCLRLLAGVHVKAPARRHEIELHALPPVGKPERVSLLVAMLLELHQQPGIRLVAINEQPRNPLPAFEQGPK